jgi:hypothetical protein
MLASVVTAAAATNKSSSVYILRLNAISCVDAVNFQRSELALCVVGLAKWYRVHVALQTV